MDVVIKDMQGVVFVSYTIDGEEQLFELQLPEGVLEVIKEDTLRFVTDYESQKQAQKHKANELFK